MPGLAMNHAMVYSKDVDRALEFYRGLLGMKLLEDYRHGAHTVYARLKSPRGSTTIALHALEPGQTLATGGIRLYFEVEDLASACKRLEKAGAVFTQPPKMMPWGWKHAYLNDPDGHEVSLYWSAGKRLTRSTKR
jgi:catechol 2,3-dioxygenase-like lactoylglutathione lyase family enzyme